MKRVVIAGASGFIGKNLINELLDKTDYEIIALSRSEKDSHNPRLSWKKCDLFSVKEIEDASVGADVAYYLVHSMQPSARLDQASFIDYDLILVDNFGRAAKENNIKKVIYLSGIMPVKQAFSKHLLSRLEVEEVLKEYFEDYVILRAGLILGKDGSSFNILANLVRRLPILICPHWATNATSPVYFTVVTDSLVKSLQYDKYNQHVYDLCSKNNISYYELLKVTASSLGLKRLFFQFPFNIDKISRRWVSFFSGASKNLVYPLLESLSYNMVARSDHIMQELETITVEEAIDKAIKDSDGHRYKFITRPVKRKTVRSVQRFVLPKNMNARDLAFEYMAWLPKFLSPFIKVVIKDETWVYFCIFSRKFRLLTLHLSEDRSTLDRQLFYIKGGMLASKNDKGRLEFRVVLGNRYALAAIHEFKPALPWYIYRYTQAVIHLIVMKSFGRHLSKLKGKSHG